MNVPVVVIIFKRFEKSREVLEAISKVRPPKLFVVGDGPRPGRPDESLEVERTRALFSQISWPCEVHYCYSEINLGLCQRVSSGISWAFQYVDKAIILEDDTVPSEDFFVFCEELLERYSDDPRIMAICGTDYADIKIEDNSSYYFSKYTLFWGWATWARAWQHYDGDMKPLVDGSLNKILKANQPTVRGRLYWKYVFNKVYRGKLQSWGFRWLLSCWGRNGLCVYPSVNLVRNIGFDTSATNTAGRSEYERKHIGKLNLPLVSPIAISANCAADVKIEDYYFSKSIVNRTMWVVRKMKRLVDGVVCGKA